MPQLKSFNLADYEMIICGSGLFGLTIACEYTRYFGKKVLVIEKRKHPGGNSWSEFDSQTSIEIHKYGSHLFHTSNEKVWKFINQYSQFTPYQHKVIAKTNSGFFNIPINLMTLSRFFGRQFSPSEAEAFLETIKSPILSPVNFEEAAVSQIGEDLYTTFFKGYTKKQWQTDPKQLSADIFKRIPIRLNFDERYFSDVYQGLPKEGYCQLIENMLAHKDIHLALEVDFNSIKESVSANQLIVYTGPIDQYFDYRFGQLGWRTLDFEIETLDVEDYQGNSVINYVEAEVPFTRIHEFKHLHPEREYAKGKTIIMREYSRFAGREDEPYYPIASSANRTILRKYRDAITHLPNVFFGGRLGSFQYLDMHMAIASALTMFSNEIIPAAEKLRHEGI